jgi:hypothetical protein
MRTFAQDWSGLADDIACGPLSGFCEKIHPRVKENPVGLEAPTEDF